jgi:hypothetical protein
MVSPTRGLVYPSGLSGVMPGALNAAIGNASP